MRFGRRARTRTKVQARVQDERTAGGAVVSEERSALIGAPAELTDPLEHEAVSDTSDATQQLLTCLGRFQRELTNAHDGSQAGLWADECMNQLIASVEVSHAHGWSEMTEALSDAGRVLQTHENAGQPGGCIDFLNDAYEILCLMVGDLIVDKIRPSVVEQWRERYARAVADLESRGLALVADDEPPAVLVDSEATAPADDVAGEVLPFELPSAAPAAESCDESLPVLDELPPLDVILSAPPADETAPSGADEPEPAEIEDAPVEAIVVEAGAEDVGEEPAGPSRLVVQILDQLCEQLSAFETGDGAARDLAIDRYDGGARALQREARSANCELAAELSELMLRAVRLVRGRDEVSRQRFTELGYAFCGAYTEAVKNEDEAAEALAWRAECAALVADWQGDTDTREPPAADADAPPDLFDSASEVFGDVEDAPADAVEVQPRMPEAEAEPVVADIADESAVAETAVETADDDSSSGLLASAQRAAMAGDASTAKRLALQAAASIAGDEVRAAGRQLEESETRLKESLEASKDARAAVANAETGVAEAASEVSEEESALGQAKEEAAGCEQRLHDLREDVADIENRIAELQERREAELANVSQTETEFGEAQKTVGETETGLAAKRAAEDQARTTLETGRQDLSDLQRATSDIENEVEGARGQFAQKTKSSADINEAIQQIFGGDAGDSDGDNLLF